MSSLVYVPMFISPGYRRSVTLYSVQYVLDHCHAADITVCELDFLVGELKEWLVFN